MGPIFQSIPPIHNEGYRFILIFLAISAFLFLFSSAMGWSFFVLAIACALFFRDPDRVTPKNANAIVSAADGIITSISTTKPPQELNMGDEEVTQISTFLSVFDVHVNRIPVTGIVVKTH